MTPRSSLSKLALVEEISDVKVEAIYGHGGHHSHGGHDTCVNVSLVHLGKSGITLLGGAVSQIWKDSGIRNIGASMGVATSIRHSLH